MGFRHAVALPGWHAPHGPDNARREIRSAAAGTADGLDPQHQFRTESVRPSQPALEPSARGSTASATQGRGHLARPHGSRPAPSKAVLRSGCGPAVSPALHKPHDDLADASCRFGWHAAGSARDLLAPHGFSDQLDRVAALAEAVRARCRHGLCRKPRCFKRPGRRRGIAPRHP